MLTERANEYLRSLKRLPAIPTKEVEKIILDAGYPVFDCWLDFHDRYAGYVEVLGCDSAILGLSHEASYWYGPRTVDIDRELHEEIWYITCAELHPSYTYRLENNGEFLGVRATSFDIHVERCGLLRQFSLGHQTRWMTKDELLAVDARNLEPFIVPEASDTFSTYYENETHLLIYDVEDEQLRRGVVRLP